LKSFTRLLNKKRAISPVIAVILLIGLAVAAAAAIFLIVLPLFQAQSNLQMDDAYVVYDDEYTTAADLEEGYGKGTLVLSNTGTADIEIVSVKVFSASSILGPWTEITEHDGLLISQTNPYTVETLATLEELNIRFLIPDENDDNTVFYRFTLTTSDGDEFDTATEDIDETDMQLAKDRPDISYAGTMEYLRREEAIRPSQVSDNSEIKNVIYDVYFEGNDSLARSETIQPPNTLWQWTWNTRNNTEDGLHNGSYYMIMTVNDYAGLSDMTDPIDFIIDNDYTPPTINSVTPEAAWAEVGESYEIVANVIDTGCGDSQVEEVWLYYKLVNETSYTSVEMDLNLGDNYVDSISIDARALEVNLTYYIEAIDLDDNKDYNYTPILEANDTKEPNITFDPTDYDEGDEGIEINITAIITDPGIVDKSKVFLFQRKSNDLEANATITIKGGENLPSQWIQLSPSGIQGNEYYWLLDEENVTLHGIDYYISATDFYGGNTAQHGTPTVPHHIDIPDEAPPSYKIYLEEYGKWVPGLSLAWTETEDFDISVEVEDLDPTFGRVVNGDYTTYATGSVKLFYRTYDDDNKNKAFSSIDLIHSDGNSSDTGKSTWTGTIPGGTFVFDNDHEVNFYIQIDDQSLSSGISDFPAGAGLYVYESIDVKEAGTPILNYDDESVTLNDDNDTVSFMITNDESSAMEADATLAGLLLEVYGVDWDFSNGKPNLTVVEFTRFATDDSYNDTSGSPHPWVNGSWIWFDQDNLGIVTDDAADNFNTIKLTFENTTGPTIDMHSMVLNVTFYVNVSSSHKGNFTLDPLIATPGVEPQSALYQSYLSSGRYYINHWLATPLYAYGSSGLGWDSEFEEPWASPSEYSRQDVASGDVKPYDGFSITTGTGSHTTNTWKHVVNNDGYRMNIDGLTGGANYQYIWFYAVILVDGSIPGSVTMYLGSDDEAICYINGQLAGSYGSPRGYGESQFEVSSLLVGNNENNYILFGVHEDSGSYHGGLAFAGIGQYDIKTYIGPPPGGPFGGPLLSIEEGYPESNVPNSNITSDMKPLFKALSITPIETLRESIYTLFLEKN
jgi:hypothetical protein